MTPDALSSGFRRFALDFYAAPGAEAALLALQEAAGWDVVLALYGLWRAGGGEALGPEEARKAADLAEEWTARVVRPLRAVRREMKTGFRLLPPEASEAARREVKALELAMELRLIGWLEALPLPRTPWAEASEALALANLRALGAASGRAGGDLEALARLWEVWRRA